MNLDVLPPLYGSATPPFGDVRAVREWLKLLPLINIPLAHSEIHTALSDLNRSRVDAFESLRILEQLRESTHTVASGLLTDYQSTTLPLAGKALLAWQNAQVLWYALESAYARCWRGAIEGETGLADYQSLLAERTLYYARLQIRDYLLVYRQIPEAHWQRLFAYFVLARELGIAETKAKDSLIELGAVTTPQALFAHSLLLAAARTQRLNTKQILWLDARLEFFSQRTSLAADAVGVPGKLPLSIVLARPSAPMRGALPLTGPDILNLDTHTLGQVLSKRIKLLREGELPQNLGLGLELGLQAAEALLSQVYRAWCDQATQYLPPVPPDAARITVSLGFANQHNDIGGESYKPFTEKAQSMGTRDLVDIQLFGRAVSKQQANARPPVQTEQWLVLAESAQQLQLLRPVDSAQLLELSDFLVIHAGQQKLIGIVRALTETSDGVQAQLQILPGQPFAGAVRARDGSRFGQNDFVPVLILPPVAALRTPVSLIVPHGWYRQGRMLELWDGHDTCKIRLDQLLERCADHDRAHFIVV